MSTSPQENRVFVGVNLSTREVTQIARYPELVLDAYVVEGTVEEDGLIVLDSDDETFNGEAALDIALASQDIGLGWRFATICGYCNGRTVSTTECGSCGVKP